MAGPYRVRHYTLSLSGSAQRLSDALSVTTPGGVDDLPVQFCSVQADGANSHAIELGGPTVSTSDWGIQVPIPVTSIPAPPIPLTAYMGRFRLSDIWAVGTAAEKLHIFYISP